MPPGKNFQKGGNVVKPVERHFLTMMEVFRFLEHLYYEGENIHMFKVTAFGDDQWRVEVEMG